MAIIKKDGNYMGLPMNIARGNPIPLDTTEIWYSKTDMETYAKNGATAYVGQILAYVDETSGKATAYIITNTAGDLSEVGSATIGDGKSLELVTVAATENVPEHKELRIIGIDTAEVGAQLTKDSTGAVKWVKPDTTTVDGLSSTVADHGKRLNTAENDIDNLEAKFANMGAVFNFVSILTTEEFAATTDSNGKIDVTKNAKGLTRPYAAGDVVLVGEQEYVVVNTKKTINESEIAGLFWEAFGDAQGVTKLQSDVAGLKTKTETLEGTVSEHTTAIGVKEVKNAEGEITTPASGLYKYADDIAKAKADAAQAAAEKVAKDSVARLKTTVDKNTESIKTNTAAIALKADQTALNNAVQSLEGKISLKLDKSEFTTTIANYVTNDTLTTELGKKADKTELETTNGNVTQNANDINTNKGKIEALEGRANTLEATVGNATSGLVKKVNALETKVGASGDAADKTGTLYARIAKAQVDAESGIANAATAQSAAEAAQATANKAKSTAGTNATNITKLTTRVKANEDFIATVDTTYETKTNATAERKKISDKVSSNESAIAGVTSTANKNKEDLVALTTRVTTNEEKTTKNTNDITALKGTNNDTEDSVSIKGAKKYTDSKIATVNSTITQLKNDIGNLENIMNFVGVLTANEQGQITSTGVHGDVGILGDKEYVFVATNPSVSKTDGTWHELGDISAQSEGIAALQDRAKALEDTVNGTGDLSNGLVKKVAALETADSTQDGIITDQGNRITALENKVNNADTGLAKTHSLASAADTLSKANKGELDALTPRVTANEEAISNLDASYKAADTALDSKFTEQLTWGSF